MIDRSLNYGRHHISNFLKVALPFQKVLDLGAGNGADLQLARNVNHGAELYAVECHPLYVKNLVELDMVVHSLNIENDPLPFENISMDVVILNQVLEHTKEVFWIFHEISRILAVGGKIIIGVPNLASLHNRILLACGRQPSPIKTSSAHIRGFTKDDILQFVNCCFPDGYKLSAFGGSNFYPFPPLIAIPLANFFPSFAWGIFIMLEKRKEYSRQFLDFPVNEQLETNFYTGASKRA